MNKRQRKKFETYGRGNRFAHLKKAVADWKAGKTKWKVTSYNADGTRTVFWETWAENMAREPTPAAIPSFEFRKQITPGPAGSPSP